jgi:hypothetical protein
MIIIPKSHQPGGGKVKRWLGGEVVRGRGERVRDVGERGSGM